MCRRAPTPGARRARTEMEKLRDHEHTAAHHLAGGRPDRRLARQPVRRRPFERPRISDSRPHRRVRRQLALQRHGLAAQPRQRHRRGRHHLRHRRRHRGAAGEACGRAAVTASGLCD